MVEISVCMIVKNEQKILARCLDSLMPIADELIIVDTGSTDATMDVARKYTKNLYTFEWTGSFADARNFAFSKATREYIYSADADEVIDAENLRRFMLLKQAMLPEIEIVQMKYKNQLENGCVYNFDEEYRPKLFRRLREFRWTCPIHETVALHPVVYDSDIEILHFPASKSAARDFAAFLKASASGPLDKRLHHMYATELFLAGGDDDFTAAAPYFESALSDASRSVDERIESLAVTARAARLGGDVPRFFKLALKSIIGTTPCSEICCELGDYFFCAGDAAEAYAWYAAANESEPCVSLRHSGPAALLGMAKCCDAVGDADEAARLKELAEKWQAPRAQ